MSESITHEHGGETFRSEWFAVDAPRATILMFPTVVGISDLEAGFANDLNAKGCAVFVADLYGAAERDCGRERGAQNMRRISADRGALRERLVAVLAVARETAGDAPVIAVGFCFGGLCALDLARSGADIAGAASFHGIFTPPPGLKRGPISASVIAFHGWDDPMVPPAAVVALGEELTAAGCDWQILALGDTRHAFTNPGADALPNPAVAYNQRSNDRAWRAFDGFLDDVLG